MLFAWSFAFYFHIRNSESALLPWKSTYFKGTWCGFPDTHRKRRTGPQVFFLAVTAYFLAFGNLAGLRGPGREPLLDLGGGATSILAV